ncbi:MAG: hypothetical protein J0G37_01460 [Afipia sp.]|nr:hypothetical protein [Afipia sp.]
MTILLDTTAQRTSALRLGRGAAAALALILVAVAALALRRVLPANNDVSWLLTAGEQVLAGKTLYAGVIETNPPIAVLAYIPAILIARALGVAAEPVVDGLMFVAMAAALGCVAAMLRRSDRLRDLHDPLLLAPVLAVLAVLPTQEFGQREHIALIAGLPFFAALMLRVNGATPARWQIVAAGLGAGVMLAFKPHFIFAFAGAVVVTAVLRRSWRILFVPENWIAGVVVLGYMAIVAILFPEFFTVVLPIARDVYVPVGRSLPRMMATMGAVCWLGVMLIILLLQQARRDRAVMVLVAGSLGFAGAFFMQHKGWPYQSYPMIALAFLAAITAAASVRFGAQRLVGLSVVSALIALFVSAMAWFTDTFNAQPLQAAIARHGDRPALLAISGEPGIGHPAVRALHGTWVSREASLWITAHADYMKRHGLIPPGKADALGRHVARERAWLIEDIRRQPPTVVVVDNMGGRWGEWIAADAELSALLKPYAKADSVGGVDILVRRAAAVTGR